MEFGRFFRFCFESRLEGLRISVLEEKLLVVVCFFLLGVIVILSKAILLGSK